MGKTIRGKDKKTKQRIIHNMMPKTKFKVRFTSDIMDVFEQASHKSRSNYKDVNQ